MYTLYYSPGACSLAVHTVLNELNVPFELASASLPERKNRDPEFLKLNPRGQVPVLVEDGNVFLEGGAILIYLLDKHNSPLLPKEADARAKAIEWLLFCNSTLHPAYSRSFFLAKTVKDAALKEELLLISSKAISTLWETVEAQLSREPYLAGKECTVADILLTVIANWSLSFPQAPITLGERVTQHLKKISTRPSFIKAMEREGVTYKVA